MAQGKVFKNGFTIVEMLLVTGLLVLLVGAAGGFYAGTYKKTLVRKSARDFLLAAKYARVLAIERQSKCRLRLDTDNNGFVLFADEFDEEEEETKQRVVRDLYFKPVRFAEGIKFEDIRITPADSAETFDTESRVIQQNTITFQPDGTVQAAVIQIGDGRNHYTVSMSAASGKIRIYAETAKDIKSDTLDLDEEQW